MDTVGASTFGARFDIVDEAGSGGMGKVYEAIDRTTNARVAIKVMTDAGDRERFAREVEVLENLEHEAIVKHVGHGDTAAGQPFLAMQWLAGESLSKRLKRGTLSVDETLRLGARVAGALAYAHAAGVIHRDLKPSNVYLVDSVVDRACVIDFGVAKTQSVDLTTTGQMIGTPGYMAPEQVRGERSVDQRVDVFALGCVLYESIAGEAPFEGGEVLEVLSRLLLERPRPIAGAPARFGYLLDAMLAKDQEHRLADCAVVRGELLAIATALAAGDTAALAVRAPGIPIPPADTGSSKPTFSLATHSPPTQVERPSAKRSRSNRRWIWLALTVVGAVTGGAVGAVLVLRHGDSPSPPTVLAPIDKPVIAKKSDNAGSPACNDVGDPGCAALCEQDDPAGCWLHGKAIAKTDSKGALAAFERSCRLGGVFACADAATILLAGQPDAKKLTAAAMHLERGCTDGDNHACLVMGEQARTKGLWPDVASAFKLVGAVCDDHGDDEFRGQACAVLRDMIAKAEGTESQRSRAQRIADNACKRGVERACR